MEPSQLGGSQGIRRKMNTPKEQQKSRSPDDDINFQYDHMVYLDVFSRLI